MLHSNFSHFILDVYIYIGDFRYICATVIMFIYMFIIVANLSLAVLICTNRGLHEPMYLFLCSLLANQLCGTMSVYPLLIIQILTDVHTISYPFCFVQIFFLYCYTNIEYLTLAVMSYDRYLAICRPLQYPTKMTPKKVGIFVAVIWLCCIIRVMAILSVTATLPLCGNVINSLYCINYLVVKLACKKAMLNNLLAILTSVTLVYSTGCILPTIASYFKIIKVCFDGSDPSSRKKALNTCIPQVVSLVNFTMGCSFEVLRERFNSTRLPIELQFFLAMYLTILQPVLTPLMYGMRLSKIRNAYNHMYFRKMLARHKAPG